MAYFPFNLLLNAKIATFNFEGMSGNFTQYIVATGIAVAVIAAVIVLIIRYRRRIAEKNLSIYNLINEQYRLEKKLEEEQTKNKVLTEIVKSK